MKDNTNNNFEVIVNNEEETNMNNTAIENNNNLVVNNNEEEITMTIENKNIATLEAEAIAAAQAAAQAKNAYDEVARVKKATAELNKMFGAKKSVFSNLNQIAKNNVKVADARLQLAYLGEIKVDFFTAKQLEKHNKKIAKLNDKIVAANNKIAIYREKLVVANDKLVDFNEQEIIAATLAVLGGVAAPVVVEAPAPVVETIDIDSVLAKVNAAVAAARKAEVTGLNARMQKTAAELAELSAEIDAPIFDHTNNVLAGFETMFNAPLFDHVNNIEVAVELIAKKAETENSDNEEEEYIPTAEEEAEAAAFGDFDPAADYNPADFEDTTISSEDEVEEPVLEDKTVVGTVEEPDVVKELDDFQATLVNENVEEPKAEEKPVEVNPVAEARRKMYELMAKKAGNKTVEKKDSTEAPKTPVAAPKTETAKPVATPKVEEPATLESIKEETNTSYDPKIDCESAYMPKVYGLRKKAKQALFDAFHAVATDTGVSAASIWDTIGDETPEIVDPYAPYVAPKAERTARRDLNHAEYLNGDMALESEEEDEKVVVNPSCTNYDDIMAACGY